MNAILVLDDNPEERQQLVEAIRGECSAEAEIIPFDSGDALDEGASFEHHIASWIDGQRAEREIGLIVCDKELGRYDNLPGLSATPVSAVAMQKGLPFCQYSRHANDSAKEIARFKGLQQWSSEEITLEDQDPQAWAAQATALFDGFELIKNRYAELGGKKPTPASALAAILEHPESESQIALYGSGEQGFLKEILTFYDPAQGNIDELLKRMPRILGNWLFLSILRFPGILVNEIAAASYLNIACEAFAGASVQRRFENATYTGPFSKLGPWWWRAELDAMLVEAECEDGRALLAKEMCDVAPCPDPQSGEPAGYYCMLTRSPVSSENSRGGVSWFPAGADLARVVKDKFEQITALIGMY